MSTGLLNENAALRARLEAMEARISRPTPPAERDAIEAAKVRFDTVMAPLGVRAPDPTPGQTAEQYLRNRLRDAAEHSPRFSGNSFTEQVLRSSPRWRAGFTVTFSRP